MSIFKKKPPETPPERPAKKKATIEQADAVHVRLRFDEPVAHDDSPAIAIGPQGRACRVDGFIHAEAACPVCGTVEGNS